jgi:N-acetylmuramic acid 6-phosphate etherase
MVDVVPSNQKLVNRALRIIQEITGCGPEEAETLLKESRGNPKTAVVMHRRRMEYEEARRTLEEKEGSLREALE